MPLTPEEQEARKAELEAKEKEAKKKKAAKKAMILEPSRTFKLDSVSIESQYLLTQLLKFHPEDRVTVKQALAHPMFDQIRQPNNERPSPVKIDLHVDSKLCPQELVSKL